MARVSPDERHVAFIVGTEAGGRVWLRDTATGEAKPLTDGATASSLAWNATSDHLALNDVGPPSRLYTTTIDGSGVRTGLAPTGIDLRVDDWSPNSRWMVYEQDGQVKKTDLWLLALLSEGTPAPAAASDGADRDAAFSPDGKWMAYVREEAGRDEVVAQTYPVPGTVGRVSRDGGISPRWSADGTVIYFQSLDGRLMSVGVTTEPSLTASEPRPLFALRGGRFQQPSPDSQRFLVLLPAEATVR